MRASFSAKQLRRFTVASVTVDLTDAATRYNIALILLAAALFTCLVIVRSPFGRVLAAIRENEERTSMLGFNTYPLQAGRAGQLPGRSRRPRAPPMCCCSPTPDQLSLRCSIRSCPCCGCCSAACARCSVRWSAPRSCSIWWTSRAAIPPSYLLVVGLALIGLILWFPRGLMGMVREKVAPWLP